MSSDLDRPTLETVDRLTEAARIALFEHLLTTIPRYHLTNLHARLSSQLRRDIVASLPQELALSILGQLDDTSDLISCASVSKRWRLLATDGELWRARCAIEGVEARKDTTWGDVFAQRERQETCRRSRAENIARNAITGDDGDRIEEDQEQLEGWVEDGDDADERRLSLRLARDAARPRPPLPTHVHAGVRLGVVERSRNTAPTAMNGGDGHTATAGSALDSDIEEEMDIDIDVNDQVPVPVMLLPRPRRPTFNTGRQQSGLPVFLLPAAGVSGDDGLSTSPKAVTAASLPQAQPSTPLPSLLSYASSPTASPRPDARHLYLTHRLLRNRFLRARPASRVLDGKTSLSNGGLPGHSDGVYCLQLIHGRMKVYKTPTGSSVEMDEASAADRHGSPVSPTRPMARSPRRRPSTASFSASGKEDVEIFSVTARDWLLSGSRDQTIRLWDLDGMRCVRVFGVDQDGRGHRSSVLTLHAEWVRRDLAKRTTQSPPKGTAPSPSDDHNRHSSLQAQSLAAASKRLLLVAGGSDGKLVLWDILSGKIEGEIQAHEPGDSVLCVRFDENRIVSCSKDRSIRVFDLQTLERTLVIGGAFSTVGPAAENHPLTSDIPPGGPASQLESGHKAAVNAIELVGDRIVSVSGDRCLCVWHAVTGELLFSTEDHSRGVASLAIDPLSGDVVTGCSDWAIRSFKLGDALTGTSSSGSTTTTRRRSSAGSACENDRRVIVRGTAFRADSTCTSCRALEYGRRRMLQQQQQQRPARGGWAAPLSEARAQLLAPLAPSGPQPGLENPLIPGWPPTSGMHQAEAGPSGITPVSRVTVDEPQASVSGAPAPAPEGMPLLSCESCQTKTHRNLVRALWLGRDVVVSGSYDAKVKIWNRHTHSLIADFPSLHAGRLFSIVGDATKVVSSGIDQKIVIWDFAQGLDTSFV